jgi:hypothetical protein
VPCVTVANVRATLSALAVLCGGFPLSAALAAGLVGPAANAAPLTAGAGGSLHSCVAYAYAAIERHQVIAATPAACRGLSRAEVNQAAGIAIRMTVTSGAKADRRKQAVAAARWARAMITVTAPVPGPVASAATLRPSADGPAGSSGSSGPSGGLGLGGVSEFAAKLAALLAWLATAASGGFVLVRWLLAGGSPLRRTVTSAPPVVILGHVGAGALGLVLWVSFMLSGWVALAWTALAILAPVAGLGMGVLLLGLPGPVRPRIGTRGKGPRARIPVLAIVGHGMFAATALLLVLMATIGAG